MTAADHLTRDVLESPGLWALLLPVTPDEVSVHSAPAWMRLLWAPGIAAMTIGATIFVDPYVLQHASANALNRLLIHELVHARQWRLHGPIRFAYRYLREYVAGRMRGLGHDQSYRSISFEAEARAGVSAVR